MTERPDVNELDEVELGMIKRGDMLGPRLGAKTYRLLLSQAQEIERLRFAANAVIKQWDTPNWKLTEPTAGLINQLREALANPVADGDN